MSVVLEPADGKGLKIAIDKAIVFIGRHPECDVVITRSRMISRKHCAIVQVNDSLAVRDLGSTNGVKINGRRIRKEDRFQVGDILTIGDIEYAVKLVKTPELERRANRDHPQDARAAGSVSLPVEALAKTSGPYSQEVPVVVSEDEDEFENQELESDTPSSVPQVRPREPGASERPLPEPRRPYSDSDSHIPLVD